MRDKRPDPAETIYYTVWLPLRCVAVINSCKSIEQFMTATNYCKRAQQTISKAYAHLDRRWRPRYRPVYLETYETVLESLKKGHQKIVELELANAKEYH